MKNEWIQLGKELAGTLEKFKPMARAPRTDAERKAIKAAYDKQYSQSKHEFAPRNKRVVQKVLFPKIQTILGLSFSAVRMRFYRGKIAPEVLQQARAEL